MAATSNTCLLSFLSHYPMKPLEFSSPNLSPTIPRLRFASIFVTTSTPNSTSLYPPNSRFQSCFSRKSFFSTTPVQTLDYVFTDGSVEVELRLQLGGDHIQSPKDIIVDANDTSLTIRVQHSGSIITLLETNQLFGKIRSSETIWYIDDEQLVVNMKKHDPEVKWPDIVESWESLTAGSAQLLKGTSIHILGDSTEINQKVAQELAIGIGYTPLSTKELLETFTKKTIDSWALAEGSGSVAEAERAILESLSSHVRTVVATIGGQEGAARRSNAWRHLYAGFTVWLSQTEATDENTAMEEARKHVQDGQVAYSNADAVVKYQGWDSAYSKTLAQASLSALKQLILSDKKLPGKKSLYIRLGCRGDWPNIKPPGWDPSVDNEVPSDNTGNE